jgi:hypothetical protein
MRSAGALSVVIFAFLASACAIDGKKLADEELSRAVGPEGVGHATVLAYTKVGDTVQVNSAVLARGTISRDGAPQELVSGTAGWGTLEIASPAADRAAMVQALDIGKEGGVRWLNGATSGIGEVLDLIQPLNFSSMHIKVVVVPKDVAYSYDIKSMANEDPFALTFLVRVDHEAGKPAAEWYSEIVKVTAHELLHLSYFLSDLAPPNKFNEEAAASILGMCGTVLFARALEARVTVGLALRDSHLYLSSDDPPTFSPNRRYVERGAPTTEGSNMAHAVLMTTMGPEFASDDEKVDLVLLPACSDLGGGTVPDFVSGASLKVNSAQ